jgi:hypothetical protein
MPIQTPVWAGEVFRATDFDNDLITVGVMDRPINGETMRFVFVGAIAAPGAPLKGGASVCLTYDEGVELVTKLGKALFGVPDEMTGDVK